MSSISRRAFFRSAGALSTLAVRSGSGWADPVNSLQWTGGEVSNATFRLVLSPSEALKNTRLIHAPSGLLLAEGDYSYSFGRAEFHESSTSDQSDGSGFVSEPATPQIVELL